MPPPMPAFPELIAPADWRTVDFISDVHLQPSEMKTFAAWEAAVAGSTADALFLLGDLFEVWVGDDALDPHKGDASELGHFERQCAAVLRRAAQKRPVFFMQGNRDFLIDSVAAQACSMTLLDDPTVLVFAGERWLLSHGDALCLDDLPYQQFRSQVRDKARQQAFLQQPLEVRRHLVRQIRHASEERKGPASRYVDISLPAARDWLRSANAATLVHGHTHMPGDDGLGEGLRRIVLSDWDAIAQPPRAEVLRLSLDRPPERLAAPPG